MSAHPEITLEAAQVKVIKFFELPTTTTINQFTPLGKDIFDDAMFYQAAKAAGGISALCGQYVREIDAGQTRRMSRTTLQVSGIDALSFIGKNIASGAGAWFVQKTAGWALESMGLSSLIGLVDSNAAIANELNAIGAQLTQISEALAKIPNKILQDARRLKVESIMNIMEAPLHLLNQALTTSSALSAADVAKITNDPQLDRALLNLVTNQIGSPGTPGLIQLLNEQHPRFYSGRQLNGVPVATYDRVLFDSFSQAVDTQVQALNLLIEAQHAGTVKQNLVAIDEMTQKFWVDIKRQKLMYPNGLKPMSEDGVLDRSTGLLWARGMKDLPKWDYLRTVFDGKGNGWRLPREFEVNHLINIGSEVRAFLPAADQQKVPPQLMHHFGFMNRNSTYDEEPHFADLGRAGSRPDKELSEGFIVTSDFNINPPGKGYEYRVHTVFIYNGDGSFIAVKQCISRTCNQNGDRGMTAPFFENIPNYLVPVLLVKTVATPVKLNVEFEKGFDPVTGRSKPKAMLLNSDGVWIDVTEDVIWSVTLADGATTRDAIISNIPDSSGEVQYRGPANAQMAFKVVADFPWYVHDASGGRGTLQASAMLYGSEKVTAPKAAALVLSPANKTVDSYPLSFSYVVQRVLANGKPEDVGCEAGSCPSSSGYTFKLNVAGTGAPIQSNLKITPDGGIDLASRPAHGETVEVTIEKDGVQGKAYLILK
jgi:hypothetical protein